MLKDSSIFALELLHMLCNQLVLDKCRDRTVLHIFHGEFSLTLGLLPDGGTVSKHAV